MPVLLLPTPIVETPFGRVIRPLRRESSETFVFLGFTPEEAKNRSTVEKILMDDPDRVVSMLTTIVAQLPDRIGCDFQEYFDCYGISRELQDAIMDPEFADIRDTASPGWWVRDAIHGRMQILEAFFTKAHFKSVLGPLAPISQEDQIASETEDCITMYKGVGAWRTANFKNVAKDSGLSFNFLLEREPLRADFSWDDPEKGPRGLYFTTQKELALKCAHYATRYTHGIGSSRIIKMCVPNEFIEDEKHKHVSVEDTNHTWRKVFTHCRLGCLLYLYKTKPPPERLAAMIEANTIISGHVSTGHDEAPLREVQNPKHRKDLNERRDVLHVEMADGREERAQQWMFRNCILKDLEDAVGNLGAGAFFIESVAERAWQPALEYHGSMEDIAISRGGDGDSPASVALSHDSVHDAEDSSDGVNLETVAAKQSPSEPSPIVNSENIAAGQQLSEPIPGSVEVVTMEQWSSEPSPTDTSKQLTVEQQPLEPSLTNASIPVEHATAEQRAFEPFSTDLAATVEHESYKPSRNDSTVPVEYLTEAPPTHAPTPFEHSTATQTTNVQAANDTTTALVNDTAMSSDPELTATSVWNPARVPIDFASADP